MSFTVKVNGAAHEVDADADTPLLWVLRDFLDLNGTKFGCGVSACGACTVHVDGVPQRSCQLPLADAAGSEITTIEGMHGRVMDAVQQAWRELDVVQCGYCQSGQIMQAVSLLNDTPKPSDEDIDSVMSGNVCRCATYHRIRAAIHLASEKLEG